MSIETNTLILSDVACNCQATVPGQGPWHPFGDTSLCPSEHAVDVIRRFIVSQVGDDMGAGMTHQAVELAALLAQEGQLRHRAEFGRVSGDVDTAPTE